MEPHKKNHSNTIVDQPPPSTSLYLNTYLFLYIRSEQRKSIKGSFGILFALQRRRQFRVQILVIFLLPFPLFPRFAAAAAAFFAATATANEKEEEDESGQAAEESEGYVEIEGQRMEKSE